MRILSQAPEPLFPSQIAELLNQELRLGAAYTATDVATRLLTLEGKISRLADGRWMLKRVVH